MNELSTIWKLIFFVGQIIKKREREKIYVSSNNRSITHSYKKECKRCNIMSLIFLPRWWNPHKERKERKKNSSSFVVVWIWFVMITSPSLLTVFPSVMMARRECVGYQITSGRRNRRVNNNRLIFYYGWDADCSENTILLRCCYREKKMWTF